MRETNLISLVTSKPFGVCIGCVLKIHLKKNYYDDDYALLRMKMFFAWEGLLHRVVILNKYTHGDIHGWVLFLG